MDRYAVLLAVFIAVGDERGRRVPPLDVRGGPSEVPDVLCGEPIGEQAVHAGPRDGAGLTRSGVRDRNLVVGHRGFGQAFEGDRRVHIRRVVEGAGGHHRPTRGNRDRRVVVAERVVELGVPEVRIVVPTPQVVEERHLREPVRDEVDLVVGVPHPARAVLRQGHLEGDIELERVARLDPDRRTNLHERAIDAVARTFRERPFLELLAIRGQTGNRDTTCDLLRSVPRRPGLVEILVQVEPDRGQVGRSIVGVENPNAPLELCLFGIQLRRQVVARPLLPIRMAGAPVLTAPAAIQRASKVRRWGHGRGNRAPHSTVLTVHLGGRQAQPQHTKGQGNDGHQTAIELHSHHLGFPQGLRLA